MAFDELQSTVARVLYLLFMTLFLDKQTRAVSIVRARKWQKTLSAASSLKQLLKEGRSVSSFHLLLARDIEVNENCSEIPNSWLFEEEEWKVHLGFTPHLIPFSFSKPNTGFMTIASCCL